MKKILSIVLSALLLVSFLVPTFAEAFTVPSIEAKPAPTIVTPKDENGKEMVVEVTDETTGEVVIDEETGLPKTEAVAALIKDGDKADSKVIEEKGKVPVSRLVLTPLSDVYDETKNVEVKVEKILVTANEDFKEATENYAIERINTDGQAQVDLRKELTERAQKVNDDYTADNYVAMDLFDVQVTNDYLEKLDGVNYMELIYAYEVEAGKPMPAVLFKCDGDENWTLIPEKDVVKNDDGTITVRVQRLCVFAFLELTDEAVVNPSEDSNWKWILLGVLSLLILIILILLIILLFKRKKDDEQQGGGSGNGRFPWWIVVAAVSAMVGYDVHKHKTQNK